MTTFAPKAGAVRKEDSRTARSRRVEHASVSMQDPDLAQAIARFDAIGDLVEQMLLAQEIARTRQSELTLAFDNVVTVASGFRTKRDGDGKEAVTRSPCVVFVVRQKWRTRRNTLQRIPAHLLTYRSVDGRRDLVAVPTDVRLEAAFVDVRPHGPSAVTVDNGAERGTGALTCMVEFVDAANTRKRMLLSALHVLSISFDADAPTLPSGARVLCRNLAPSALIALSSKIGGRLFRNIGISFDVQLGDPSATHSIAAQRALEELRFDEAQPFATSYKHMLGFVKADLPIEIVVPSNHDDFKDEPRPRVAAIFTTHIGSSLPITYAFKADGSNGEWQVHHKELLQFTPLGGARTLPGDSGCAVVCWLTDDTCCLLGMHIAGHEEGFSYAIPAWQLFQRDNYFGTLDGASEFRPVRA